MPFYLERNTCLLSCLVLICVVLFSSIVGQRHQSSGSMAPDGESSSYRQGDFHRRVELSDLGSRGDAESGEGERIQRYPSTMIADSLPSVIGRSGSQSGEASHLLLGIGITYALLFEKIEVHPYVYDKAKPLIDYCHSKGIKLLSTPPSRPSQTIQVDPSTQLSSELRSSRESPTIKS